MFTDEYFMKQALIEAQKAFDIGEVPVGAVIVAKNNIIARAHNLSERLHDPTAHAEMQAITSATNFIGSKYLKNCSLYVTLEPCAMCAGATYWTQISRIVYGADDKKRGFSTISNKIVHPKVEIIGGILQNECSRIISNFFENIRNTSL